jgi:cellulose synthase operon protein C
MSAPKSHVPLARRLRLVALGALCVHVYPSTASADFDARGRRAKKAATAPSTKTPRSPAATSEPDRPKPTTKADVRSDNQRSSEVLIARYTQAALQQPGNTFPLQRLAELYRERDGNLDALRAQLQTRLEAEPKHLGVLLALGWLNELEGRSGEARAMLERANLAQPTNPAPLLALAESHEREGSTQQVSSLLERALRYQKTPAEREQTLRRLRALAIDRKDLEAARGFHRELVTQAKDSTFVRSELGRELLLRGLFSEAAAEFERVVRASQGDNRALPPLLLDLGQAQAGAQDTARAISTFEKALALTPADSGLRRDVLTSLGSAYRHANRLPEFITFLERNRATDFAQHVLLADVYVDSGRLEDAANAYRGALRQSPRDIDTRLKLVHLLELRGDLKAAIAEYRALIRLVPSQSHYVFELSDLLRKVGDRKGALRELDLLTARTPLDVDTLASAVDYYERIGEPQKAQALLERVAALTNDPEHLIELGGRYFAAGDETKATATWKRVLELLPDKAKAHHMVGDVYLQHDLTAMAMEALNQAVNLEPANPRYKRSLALALERTGASSPRAVRLQRYAEAQRLWESLLTTSAAANQKREARQHIATLWSLQGSLKDRVAPLERAFRTRPPHLPSGRMLTEVYQRLNELEKAEQVLRELTLLTPGDASLWATLEQVLVNRHQLKAAIPVAERLVELEPKRAREHYQRLSRYAASLYLDEEAIKYARKAVTLSPDDAEGHRRLGDMYRKREQLDLAAQSYRKAISLNERLYDAYLSLAELSLIQGQVQDADKLWRALIRSAADAELIRKAARASMQLNLSAGTAVTLERELLPLAIANPEKPVYRTLLVDLYAAWTAPLVERLKASKDGEQGQEELLAIGKRALKPLLDVLADPAANQHLTAIELLSRFRNPDANLPLLSFAKGQAPATLRERAFIAIGLAGPDNVANQLQAYLFDGKRMQVDESSKVSLAAVWAYCRVASVQTKTQLYQLLGSDAPTAQVLGLITLTSQRSPLVLDRLAALLTDDNHPYTQAAAAFALGELGANSKLAARHSGLLSRIADLAVEGSPLIRATALTTLSRLRHPSYRSAAVQALLSPDAELRVQAARSTTAYVTEFRPDVSGSIAQPVDAATLLAFLLPPRPRADQAIEALNLLADDVVAEGRNTHTKSESHAVALADAFTRSSRWGFSPLTDGFDQASPESQRSAETTAQAMALELVDQWTQLTTHPSVRVRSSALRVLLRLDSPPALEVVSTLLTAHQGDDATLILALLEQHPRAELIPSILRLLTPERPWSLRRQAATTLAVSAVIKTQLTDKSSLLNQLSERMFKDDNAFVREALVLAYAAWSGDQGRPLLERVARVDAEPSVRKQALKTLETFP